MRSLKGKWRANYSPKLKQRTALLRKLKDRRASLGDEDR